MPGGLDVGFDGRLEAVDARALRQALAGLGQSVLVCDRAHALELEQPLAQIAGQGLGGPLADRGDAGAGAQQAAEELTLVVGESGFD